MLLKQTILQFTGTNQIYIQAINNP